MAGNSCRCYFLTYLIIPVVSLCHFFVVAGNSFGYSVSTKKELMMALSTLLVTMHVDFVINWTIFNILKCEFMSYTIHDVLHYGFV